MFFARVGLVAAVVWFLGAVDGATARCVMAEVVAKSSANGRAWMNYGLTRWRAATPPGRAPETLRHMQTAAPR